MNDMSSSFGFYLERIMGIHSKCTRPGGVVCAFVVV